MIDENGRLFGRVNLIDLLVILGVFVVAAIVFVTLTKQGKVVALPENKVVNYTVLIKGIRPDVASYVKKGDIVKKQSTQSPIGTIKAVEIKPSQVVDFNGTNRIVSDSPVDKDVYVTIETKGRVGGDMISTGNEVLRVGDKFNVVTKWFFGEAVIVKMSVKGDRS